MVTVMTVDVGFAGQKLFYPMLGKIRQPQELIDERNLDVDIQVMVKSIARTFKDVIERQERTSWLWASGLFNVDKDRKAVQIVKRDPFNRRCAVERTLIVSSCVERATLLA